MSNDQSQPLSPRFAPEEDKQNKESNLTLYWQSIWLVGPAGNNLRSGGVILFIVVVTRFGIIRRFSSKSN